VFNEGRGGCLLFILWQRRASLEGSKGGFPCGRGLALLGCHGAGGRPVMRAWAEGGGRGGPCACLGGERVWDKSLFVFPQRDRMRRGASGTEERGRVGWVSGVRE